VKRYLVRQSRLTRIYYVFSLLKHGPVSLCSVVLIDGPEVTIKPTIHQPIFTSSTLHKAIALLEESAYAQTFSMRCLILLIGFVGLISGLPTDTSTSAGSTGATSKSLVAGQVYLPPIPFGGRELHNLTIDPLTGTVDDEVFSAASNLRCETSGASPLTRNIQYPTPAPHHKSPLTSMFLGSSRTC
jgi:hypothetical protein